MITQRDDFPKSVTDKLARRVGMRCSNLRCRQLTSGPQDDPAGAVNVGVAAHITAAAEGGPRYDRSMSPKERSSPENGIWLCQKCAALIDRDVKRYTVELLQDWKRKAEDAALAELEGNSRADVVSLESVQAPAATEAELTRWRQTADYFERLGECLADVATDLNDGQFPTRQAGELYMFANSILSTVEDVCFCDECAANLEHIRAYLQEVYDTLQYLKPSLNGKPNSKHTVLAESVASIHGVCRGMAAQYRAMRKAPAHKA